MRDLRKKLMASIAMVVVAGVMLTGTSYAWFTLSTNPEVKGVTATATSNANLEIAYNEEATAPDTANTGNAASTTGNYATYGNLVTMDAAGGNTTSQVKWRNLSKELRPMTAVKNTGEGVTTSTFNYMQYGNDGRPSTLSTNNFNVVSVADSNNACGNIALKQTGKNQVNYGYFVRYWMRTNLDKANTLQLSTATARSNDATSIEANSKKGDGSGTFITVTRATGSTVANGLMDDLVKNIRIAFYKGDAPVANAVTVIDPSSWTLSGDPYNTSATLTLASNIDTGITLAQNTNEQVYMYVYLDGTNMSNALADAIDDGKISIQINTQFSLTEMVDASGMSVTGTTPTPAGP